MPTLLAHLGAAIRPDRDNFRHLAEVKAKYDPTNLFRVNRNIRG